MWQNDWNSSGTPLRARLLALATVVVALFATMSSLAGRGTSLYRANDTVRAAFQGNDLVTVVLVVPLLLGGLIAHRRGSLAGGLLWLGASAYMVYNYAFYLFGAAFNPLFLAYVGVVALSGLVLVFGLADTDAVGVKSRVGDGRRFRWIAAFLLGLPSLLSLMWITQIAAATIAGTVPKPIIDSGIHTGVVYALDLGLLLPASLLSGVWLWQRRSMGYVLAAVLLVKDSAYAMALISMSSFAASANVPDAWALAPVWAVVGALAITATVAVYRPLLDRSPASHHGPSQQGRDTDATLRTDGAHDRSGSRPQVPRRASATVARSQLAAPASRPAGR